MFPDFHRNNKIIFPVELVMKVFLVDNEFIQIFIHDCKELPHIYSFFLAFQLIAFKSLNDAYLDKFDQIVLGDKFVFGDRGNIFYFLFDFQPLLFVR